MVDMDSWAGTGVKTVEKSVPGETQDDAETRQDADSQRGEYYAILSNKNNLSHILCYVMLWIIIKWERSQIHLKHKLYD